MYDFRARSDVCKIDFTGDPGFTKQEFADSCNIHTIMKKYVKNGNNPFVVTHNARFMDITGMPDDYRAAYEMVLSVDSAFDSLDAKVRARFKNDPAQLLDFMNNPLNVEEAISLGLAERRVVPPTGVVVPSVPVPNDGKAGT